MQWQIVQRHKFAENGEGSFQANNPLSSVQDDTGCKKMPTPASHHAILVFIIPVLTAFIQGKQDEEKKFPEKEFISSYLLNLTVSKIKGRRGSS
ncbi:hypothetical protein QQP08_017022 [Theobroma cacao]|nr:hypothetical protein QQP08_017022 [Theobroma cacao]